MRYGVLSMLAIAALAFAQEPKAKDVAQPEPESKVFVLKHADAQDVANLLASVFGGKNISSNREMKVIAVSGTPAMIAGVAEAITKLDVPPQPVRNVEITGYLLVGSTKGESGGSVPAELESVVKQIKASFPYKEFQLLDTVVMRTQARGKASLEGLVMLPGSERPNSYGLTISSATVAQADKGYMIRLEGLDLAIAYPMGNSTYRAGVRTEVDIREGQKVVVGKSSFGSPDKALFLVLTAKVVE